MWERTEKKHIQGNSFFHAKPALAQREVVSSNLYLRETGISVDHTGFLANRVSVIPDLDLFLSLSVHLAQVVQALASTVEMRIMPIRAEREDVFGAIIIV